MILIDSNVPMYLVGAPHRHKADAQRLLESLVAAGEPLLTDAEVMQEILHRYVVIDRREAIGPAFQVLLAVVDEVVPIERRDAERAAAIVLEHEHASARDALHVAVMERCAIDRILSFDRGFDRFPGIARIA